MKNGRYYDSITRLIREAGLMPDYPASAREKADFGSSVHKMTAFYDEGALIRETLDPAFAPYLVGWQSFRAAAVDEFLAIEQPMVNTDFGFAGTLDRVFTAKNRICICDIKTGQKEAWHKYQLAAQAILCFGMLGLSCPLINVYLNASGEFKTETFYGDLESFNVFLSILSLRKAKEK